jgi:membrane-bound ClpP family serine protease
MPVAVIVLCHPAGTYGFLLVALCGLIYGSHARIYWPLLCGGCAMLLTLLAFLLIPPSPIALLLFVAAIALMHAEFLLPTAGALGALGCGAGFAASWLVLAQCPLVARLPLGVAGTIALLSAVGFGMRRTTLRRP